MILLFDFDRTLIDSGRFVKDLCNIFDITSDEYVSQVNFFFKKEGKHYSPEAHIKILKKIGHIKTLKNASASYQKIVGRMDDYLFPETKKTLNELKKQGHRLILITLGTPSSQKKKIDNSGIKKYFEKIIYETKDKSQNKFIKNLSKLGQDVLIINDKASEAFAIKKTIGEKAKVYIVKGPHSKNKEHKEKIYNNISKIKNVLWVS